MFLSKTKEVIFVKRKNWICLLLVLVMALAMLPTAAFAANGTPEGNWADYAADAFAGGTGAKDDPYLIATAEQLAKLAADVKAGEKYSNTYFRLEADLDLSAHVWTPIGTYIWPINGTSTSLAFSGNFDGNSKTISGLYVDERETKSVAGLFGYVNCSKDDHLDVGIKDLIIVDAAIYTSEEGLMENSAGILAGLVMANPNLSITVSNVTVSGTIVCEMTDGSNKIGGLVGDSTRVTYTDCHADGVAISGGTNMGGFAGISGMSTFTNCTATGTVDGGWSLGGFVGYPSSIGVEGPDVFDHCTADVDVTGFDWNLGGFAGFLEDGTITDCVAYGDVTSTLTAAQPKVGGFAGSVGNTDRGTSPSITDSHAAGVVTGAHPTIPAGGFVGYWDAATLTGCSFHADKNPGLNSVGEGTVPGEDAIAAVSTSQVLRNICEDYYGGHSLVHVPEVDPTDTSAGNIEYWRCERCGACFADETGTIEIDPASVTLPATAPPSIPGSNEGQVGGGDWDWPSSSGGSTSGSGSANGSTSGDKLNPDTGDSSLMAGIALLAAASVGGILLSKKRK